MVFMIVVTSVREASKWGVSAAVELFFGPVELMEKQQVVGARLIDGPNQLVNAVSLSLQQLLVVLQ